MISRCINPVCHTEFKLYNSGTLYARDRRSADTEFFWLCAPCASHLVPCIEPDGSVSATPRCAQKSSQPGHPDESIRMVPRLTPRNPWRNAVPGGETEPARRWGLSAGPDAFEAA